jgi:hypothetical protein
LSFGKYKEELYWDILNMPTTAAQTLQGYSLDLKLLDTTSFGTPIRSLAKTVITNTTAAAVNATTLSLSAAASIALKVGNALSFITSTPSGTTGRQQAIVLQDITLNTTAANVTVAPLLRPIAAASKASFPASMLSLNGITQMDFNNQETMVDTTGFQSGSGTEGVVVRVQRQLSISGITVASDAAMETILKVVGGLTSGFIGKEVYAIATKPNGECFEGAAMISALNFPANQNEVDKYSCTLTFMGDSFIWTPPYSFAA